MYEKDKHTRITLRLTDEQFAFVKASADDVGTSPSEFLRMVVNMTMRMSPVLNKAVNVTIDENVLREGMVEGRENDETNCNDFLQH